jgi:hypothetical protein
VVAVPTSVGYGASLEGVTALLAMLSSCASGVVVVGIDNGFGAAHAVLRILGPSGDQTGSSGRPAEPAKMEAGTIGLGNTEAGDIEAGDIEAGDIVR